MTQNNDKCPCTSGKSYGECCGRFHQGDIPPTAIALMRSRYSAYALGLADYIMATTHPRFDAYQYDRNSWKKQILAFTSGAQFRQLEILSDHEGDAEAFVTFTAYLSRDGDDVSFTELSRFVKEGSRWLYAEGKISPGAIA